MTQQSFKFVCMCVQLKNQYLLDTSSDPSSRVLWARWAAMSHSAPAKLRLTSFDPPVPEFPRSDIRLTFRG